MSNCVCIPVIVKGSKTTWVSATRYSPTPTAGPPGRFPPADEPGATIVLNGHQRRGGVQADRVDQRPGFGRGEQTQPDRPQDDLDGAAIGSRTTRNINKCHNKSPSAGGRHAGGWGSYTILRAHRQNGLFSRQFRRLT